MTPCIVCIVIFAISILKHAGVYRGIYSTLLTPVIDSGGKRFPGLWTKLHMTFILKSYIMTNLCNSSHMKPCKIWAYYSGHCVEKSQAPKSKYVYTPKPGRKFLLIIPFVWSKSFRMKAESFQKTLDFYRDQRTWGRNSCVKFHNALLLSSSNSLFTLFLDKKNLFPNIFSSKNTIPNDLHHTKGMNKTICLTWYWVVNIFWY